MRFRVRVSAKDRPTGFDAPWRGPMALARSAGLEPRLRVSRFGGSVAVKKRRKLLLGRAPAFRCCFALPPPRGLVPECSPDSL
jgi:hypothetical protein